MPVNDSHWRWKPSIRMFSTHKWSSRKIYLRRWSDPLIRAWKSLSNSLECSPVSAGINFHDFEK
jgi:hypothetical protein